MLPIAHLPIESRMFAPVYMKLAILANEEKKNEWLSKPAQGDLELIWVANNQQLIETKADAYFDLLFQNEPGRLESLLQLGSPLFINEVIYPFNFLLNDPSKKISTPLFRINAWPGFLKRELIEICLFKKEDDQVVEKFFSVLGWKFKLVPDVSGLISARIIAMIINEAYYTLQEQVSTKQEIDIAMKLGTNYPHGPFEWGELIGLRNIYRLLIEMSRDDLKYQPAELLKREAAWH